MPASFEVLAQVQDPYLRRLLRGVPDSAVPSLGEFFHIALWRELAEEGKVQDSALLNEMRQGMSIVGPVARSGRWPPLNVPKIGVPISTIDARAWEIRAKIKGHILSRLLSTDNDALWNDTIGDVEEGSCTGPFSEDEVTHFLGTDRWIPTQVRGQTEEQGQRVRQCHGQLCQPGHCGH